MFDWGRECMSRIPDVRVVVGTWTDPGQSSGQYVLANLAAPWAVNAKSANLDLAKKALMEIGSVATEVSYAARIGNIPASRAAGKDPVFLKLTELVPNQAAAANGVFLKQATGMAAVSEGVARESEALVRKQTHVYGDN